MRWKGCRKRREEAVLLKKEPNNFYNFGVCVASPPTSSRKSFCFFFQKEVLFLPYAATGAR
jgi:hypothetical protein